MKFKYKNNTYIQLEDGSFRMLCGDDKKSVHFIHPDMIPILTKYVKTL